VKYIFVQNIAPLIPDMAFSMHTAQICAYVQS